MYFFGFLLFTSTITALVLVVIVAPSPLVVVVVTLARWHCLQMRVTNFAEEWHKAFLGLYYLERMKNLIAFKIFASCSVSRSTCLSTCPAVGPSICLPAGCRFVWSARHRFPRAREYCCN